MPEITHAKTHKLVTNLQQTNCSKLDGTRLAAGFIRTACSAACSQVATSLQQTCYKLDELNSLVTSCSSNLLSCCKLRVTNLVQLDKITALPQLVDKLATNCSNLLSGCKSTTCQQVVSNKLMAQLDNI